MGRRLVDRVAVVTGASRGIGKGVAIALGEKGATVYVTGRTRGDGERTITRARIILSEKIFKEYESGIIGRGDNIETAVMHEVVHAMGIGHSDHRNSFMHNELANVTFATLADIAAMVSQAAGHVDINTRQLK